MLTKKQKELLFFIHERMKVDDVAPSFDEMKVALGLKSKSGIHRLITALVERGFLERLPNRARALHVKKLPDGIKSADLGQNTTTGASADVVSFNDAREKASVDMERLRNITSIPLYGKIAAGTPIEALSHNGPTIDLPASMVGRGECYALKVEGDSMMNAGIHDSDIVVIQKADQARNGDIVVALIDDQEATLKTYFDDRNGMVRLHAENPAYDDRILEKDRVNVQGVLRSLYRQY